MKRSTLRNLGILLLCGLLLLGLYATQKPECRGFQTETPKYCVD